MLTFKQRLRNCWKSWTIWLNAMAGTVVTLLPVAQDNIPQIEAYVPHNMFQITMGVVIAANILLRFKTTADLKDK